MAGRGEGGDQVVLHLRGLQVQLNSQTGIITPERIKKHSFSLNNVSIRSVVSMENTNMYEANLKKSTNKYSFLGSSLTMQ